MKSYDLNRLTDEYGIDGNVPSFAWPGGYPLYYLTEDMGAICPDCVNANRELIDVAKRDNDKQWHIVDCIVNWESYIVCDNCNSRIESAYGDDTD